MEYFTLPLRPKRLQKIMKSNGISPAKEKKKVNFDHPNVCKDFLAGFCFHDLFKRSDKGKSKCPKAIHDKSLIEPYRNSKEFCQLGYEDEFLNSCRRFLTESQQKQSTEEPEEVDENQTDDKKTKRRPLSVFNFETSWIRLLLAPMPRKLMLRYLPFVSNEMLEHLKEPHRTADFFFKAFDMGSSYSILSLEAIFKLIINYNFEYPNFFDKVYTLCRPSLFHTEQKEKYIELLNTFLSSSHVPIYIIAAFAKRLMQILLVSPLDAQEPVMGLVRNLITRYPSLYQLVHRDLPETKTEDPFKSEELLSKTNALESSLWELRTLKRHWHSNVHKRACFADKEMQKTESFVRFRCPDEYFSIMMAKKFGTETDVQGEQYLKVQEGFEDEDEPPQKKGKGYSKFPNKREASETKSIPVNTATPNGKFLPSNNFNFEYSEYFIV